VNGELMSAIERGEGAHGVLCSAVPGELAAGELATGELGSGVADVLEAG
jgi:hypothetical protein